MSLFRSSSFRIKKRDKTHNRPPPLEEMPERPERESLEFPLASVNFLTVPDSARSAFFALPTAGNSRSSFRSVSATSSSSHQQRQPHEDKPRTSSSSFFKLPNLSKGSFVSTLRRDRGDPSRGRNTLDIFKSGSSDDAAHESGYIPYSKRQRPESAEISMRVSMSSMFAGLNVLDIAPPPVQSHQAPPRQRPRTLSTKSAPDNDAPNTRRSLQLSTDLPLPLPARSSLDTPSLRKNPNSLLPRFSLDTPASSGQLPEPKIPTGRFQDTVSSVPPGLYSPSPTIATSISTAQDSLMGNYEVCSSESDPEMSFQPGEDCGSGNLFKPSIGDDNGEQITYTTPLKSPVTRVNRPRPPPVRSPRRASTFSFSGPSTSSAICRSPTSETHFSPEDPSDAPNEQIAPLESITSRIKPKFVSGESTSTPVRKLAVRAGSTPPPRRLKIRRPSSVVGPSFELAEDMPPTPSTPSFVTGLAWPRPPFRQVYVDTRDPRSSWHSVSTVTDERMVDGGGNVIAEPCHVIMLAHAIDSFTLPPDMGAQQPLSPTAASALAMFTLTSRFLVSA